MEHNIVMIPIEALEHHPENPRKDLGDLRELIASIKESGIMQNLTVVPNPTDEETWWVVIGNRRLEASKSAGVKELPCIISDMDHKAQLATMMAENMQRVDLTVMEQAQGVQMMMDLGMDVSEISKRTGLRKDAVQRRALMLKYDAGQVKQAIAKGGTLSDFAELEKITDEKKRDQLLGYIGTANFRNHLRGALEDQRDWENARALAEKLDGFATQVEEAGVVNGRKQPMLDVKRWHRPSPKDISTFAIPGDVKERRYYYFVGKSYPQVCLYVAIDSATDAEEYEAQHKTTEQKRRDAWGRKYKEAETICKRHRELRIDFLRNSPNLQLDRDYLVAELMEVILSLSNSVSQENTVLLCDLLGIECQNAAIYSAHPEHNALMETLHKRTAYSAAVLLLVKLDTGWERPFDSLYENGASRPKHKKNPYLLRWYEILQHIGYEMSDEEKAMMDGSHEVYKLPKDE